MYYQNNDDYMRDFFNFNQNPNINNNFGYGYIPNTMNYNQNSNFENLYPSIYRIVYPVVKRIVANNNYQYLTEEVLKNMVNTVYEIIDGDRTINNLSDNSKRTENIQNTDSRRNGTSTTNQIQNSEKASDNDDLLKDLIKILIIQESIRMNRRNLNYINMMQNQFPQNYFESMGYM